MVKKILITGASGFIGGTLSKYLVEKCIDIIPVDIIADHSQGFEIFKCDITNFGEVKNFVEKATDVIHLAGIVDVKSSLERPQVVWGVNAHGTANVNVNGNAKVHVNDCVHDRV